MAEKCDRDNSRSQSRESSVRTLTSSATSRILLVGIGSPHGDDQAGWLVVSEWQRRLACHPEDDLSPRHRGLETLVCRLAKSPSDLLDWLEAVSHLIVCDCCESPTQLGEVRLWHWPADRFLRTRSASSHQLGLSEVLDLATNLNRLPQRVEIWTIGGGRFAPGTEPTPLVKEASQRLALQLWGDAARA